MWADWYRSAFERQSALRAQRQRPDDPSSASYSACSKPSSETDTAFIGSITDSISSPQNYDSYIQVPLDLERESNRLIEVLPGHALNLIRYSRIYWIWTTWSLPHAHTCNIMIIGMISFNQNTRVYQSAEVRIYTFA